MSTEAANISESEIHLEMFKTYRSRIEGEYLLIGNRITWPLLTAGAVVIAMTSASGMNHGQALNYFPLFCGCAFLTVFFCCVCISVMAAKTEVRRLREDYVAQSKPLLRSQYQFLNTLITARDDEHKAGDLLAEFVIFAMPALCLICCIVFATKHSW